LSTPEPAAGHRFLEDIAIADVAFRAWGRSMEEVFEQAACACLEIMVDNPAAVRQEERREAVLGEEDPEMLLFDFLQELIFYKDAESLLLWPEMLAIEEQMDTFVLTVTFAGERINPQRHQLNADVKAVTMHRFSLRQTDSGWVAEVVLDI
jgi:SHS2 domain-containing protein